MQVLVTGGAGFIGSHLVDALISLQHDVVVVDDLRSGHRQQVNPAATLVVRDITGEGEMLQLVKEYQPRIIFHLAAQPSVNRSWDFPHEDAQVNITGALQVVEAACRHGAQVIYTSSAACYGKPLYLPVDEEHPTEPLAPYGVSKLAAEKYLAAYSLSRQLEGVSLRLANVYGPRQNSQGEAGVVATFIDRARQGQCPVIHDDGEQTRDFIYVTDVVDALIQAMGKPSCVLNIGTGQPCTVNQLWQVIARHIVAAPRPQYAAGRTGDIRHSVFDPTRAEVTLGWRARHSLEEGLTAACRWYTSHG